MDNSNKILGEKYCQALRVYALRTREDKDVANQLLYLLEEFGKVRATEEEQQEYDAKYNAILAVLDEYTEIEQRSFMLTPALQYKFKSFLIPKDIKEKIEKIYRKTQIESIVLVDASEFRKEQVKRRKQISEELDKLL
jgi:hypothetical protein